MVLPKEFKYLTPDDMSMQDPSITSARRYIDFLLKRKRTGFGVLPEMPGQCIINYVPEVCESMKALYPCRSLSLGITNPMQLDIFTPENGLPFVMSHGMHGSPMAAVQLEELIALGCDSFLVTGPAGHPATKGKPALGLGDLLLAKNALIFEGTSPHYGRKDISLPSPDAVRRLKNALDELELSCTEGTVATTDALYRETAPFLQQLLDREILGIEMELSALFTVADFHGKTLAGLVFISDLIDTDGSWNIAPSPKVYRTVVRQLTRIILSFIRQQ